MPEERVNDEAVDDIISAIGEEEETEEVTEAVEETEEEEATEEQTEEIQEETTEETEEETVDPLEEKKFSQKDLDRIIGQSRIKGREYEQDAQILEKMTGMSLKDIAKYVRDQHVNKMVEETGMTEEEAGRIVDDRQEKAILQEKVRQMEEQQKNFQQQLSYNNEKARYIKNPLVKKYMAEIDAFAQGGKLVGFETAMKYVLGEKFMSGEITESIKSSTQQKTLADVNKRSKAAPESGAQAGGTVSQAPKELRTLAKLFDQDEKEVLEEWEKEQRKRRR